MSKPRSANQKLSSMINLITTTLVSSALMIWSVFNFASLILQYRNSISANPEASWNVSFSVVAILTVIPFAMGLWMLITLTKTRRPKP